MYYGIDLGTTNSVIAFSEVQGKRLVSNAMSIDRIVNMGTALDGSMAFTNSRSTTLPSYVYYDSDRVIVGDYAREMYKKYPDLVAKSIKSQMGNVSTRGLDSSVADKSPEQVSARILSHLKRQAELMNRCRIEDVIITVPANFDPARCEATRRAAEIAGFNVREEDGSWKKFLITEPNAVLYDFSQKVINGEIASSVLDLSEKKNVLVFDIGGGTLDVTIHEIEKNSDDGVTLKLSEIAVSRFTELAGDDFDNAIAEKLYDRFIEKLKENDPARVTYIATRKAIVKKMLAVTAEQIKINMNSKAGSSLFASVDGWFGDPVEASPGEEVYEFSRSFDNITYSDIITKKEFEEMLEHFMANDLTFNDYKGYSANRNIDRKNIIAPVLDALEKAARRFARNGEEMRIDAVILNGGMSKLYLIKDRLRRFFGLEPITIADPDLSVANGAAVYAALRSKYELFDKIDIVRQIQNTDLYLGLSAGVNDIIISEGDELPFVKTFEGYKIIPGTKSIEIPLKAGIGDEIRTIASGVITFGREHYLSEDLKIEVKVDQTGLLSIGAYLYNSSGAQIDQGSVEIVIGGNDSKKHGGGRIIPSKGAELVASNELDILKSLYSEKNKSRNKPQQIKSRIETILSCGNPQDFEEIILRHLSQNNAPSFRYELYRIADAHSDSWTESGKLRLKELAKRDMISAELGFMVDIKRKKLSDYVKEVVERL